MKIAYTQQRFHKASRALIATADAILTDYSSQGLCLTLRQLYYQFVARDLIENSLKSYKSLQKIVNDARLAGLLDWDAIEDRTRGLDSTSFWSSPTDIIGTCARTYKENLWADQEKYVEVWVEKDALAGVVERACRPLRVPFFSCRGYTSQSELWRAAMRFVDHKPRECVVIHLGDHDPSGVDMTRDIEDRLALFGADNTTVRRIALTMQQVVEHNPPPNPAKQKDSRFEDYVADFGHSCWELDALNPETLHKLITETVEEYIDKPSWQKGLDQESEGRQQLRLISDEFEKAVDFLILTQED